MDIDYSPSRTGKLFHADDSFIRAIKGPVGSGKSTACTMELLKRAMAQAPHGGIRETKFAIIRSTFPQLKSTTIKTVKQWFPAELMHITMGSPITGKLKCTLPDNTILDCELVFIAIDRPADIEKLKSLELTGAWVNEAGETNKDIIDVLKGRVGRFPQAIKGGPTWKGIWLDTNPTSTRSWFYKLFEIDRPAGHKIFHQPAPLIFDVSTNTYYPNPDAENINYLKPKSEPYINGFDYYLKQIPGMDPALLQTLVMGQYGSVFDGRPVYPTFEDHIHTYGTPLPLDPRLDVVVGFDFGLNTAAVFTQMDERGQLMVVDEMVGEDVVLDEFLDNRLLPHLKRKYGHLPVTFVGDPTGRNRSTLRASNAFQLMKERGLVIKAASTNNITSRIRAVEYFINRREGLLVSPACTVVREGFLGGYRYAKETASDMVHDAKPDKGFFSHSADALQYAALWQYRVVARARRRGSSNGPSSNEQYKYA